LTASGSRNPARARLSSATTFRRTPKRDLEMRPRDLSPNELPSARDGPSKRPSKGFDVVIGGVVWSRHRLRGSAAAFAPWRSSPRKRGPRYRTVRETPQVEPLHLATNANIRLRRQFEAADASTSSTRPDPVKSGTLGGSTNSFGLANVVLHKAVWSRTPCAKFSSEQALANPRCQRLGGR
jgi:hypothetical protein